MSWSLNAEGSLAAVIEQLDLHRMPAGIYQDPEQERQYERIKQTALAELRSFPAVSANRSVGVKVSLDGHRHGPSFGNCGLKIEPLYETYSLPVTPVEKKEGTPSPNSLPPGEGDAPAATGVIAELDGIRVNSTPDGLEVQREDPTKSVPAA